jgi:hypothetical protein
MKLHTVVASAFCIAVAGCASGGGTADTSGKPGAYHIKGDQIEACECNSVCPCVFNQETTYDMCQGWLGLSVREGSFEGTDLSGVNAAIALLRTGKNITASLGSWEGAIWISDTASDAQVKGMTAVIQAELGGAFAKDKLTFKRAKVTITGAGDHWEMTVGTIGEMKITGIKNKQGQVLCVHNSPSPVVMPVYYCCLADSDTYNDGTIKWDYKGRNGGYGPMEFKSK